MTTDEQGTKATNYRKGRARGKAMLDAWGSTRGAASEYWRDNLRCLAKAIGWPTDVAMDKLKAFHLERIDAVPDLTLYPELRGAREALLEVYRGIVDAGVPEDALILSESLNFWRDTRLRQETGRVQTAPTLPEKCRVVYVPETDQGALHAKNVDDPLTYWTPRPPHPANAPWPWPHPLMFDGVGSGLHIDEIPPEIFPVKALELCREHCTTVPEATEFLVRYNYFWRSQNLLIHDAHGNSMAFEKTACRVATRGPNEQGLNFITGMGALDPEIREFQTRMRQQYLDQLGVGWDSPDGCFWTVCQGKWDNMVGYIAELSANPTFEGLKALLEKRDPSGPMCLTGEKSHPDQAVAGCTLVMDIWLLDQKKLHRRQWRGDTPAYLDEPEIVSFV